MLKPIITGCLGGLLLAGCAAVPQGRPTTAPSPVATRTGTPTTDPVRQPTSSVPIAPQPATPVPNATSATAAGVVAGPDIASLPLTAEMASRALTAFRLSCAGVQRRTDSSGLTQGADWKPACDAAKTTGNGDALRFFQTQFETVQIGDGKAFATGYYEPEIAGSRTRQSGYDTPVYARPTDLIEVDLSQFNPDLKGKKVRGRVDGTALVPYFDRAQIDGGAIAGRGLEIAWAADPVELFFLEVQGSGRLRLPDGGVMRIGYASQNGRDYTGIGKLMKDRGLLGPGQTSMQGIMAWLRAHPDEGRAIMQENRSYVFFCELTGPGPLGAMGVAVTGLTSVAADPRFIPLGAPVFLSMDRTDANGLWVAQDTGGAIRGANRVDTFWGAGEAARATAGGMSARGTAFLLLPRGVLARLQGTASGGSTPQP